MMNLCAHHEITTIVDSLSKTIAHSITMHAESMKPWRSGDQSVPGGCVRSLWQPAAAGCCHGDTD